MKGNDMTEAEREENWRAMLLRGHPIAGEPVIKLWVKCEEYESEQQAVSLFFTHLQVNQ